MPIDLISIVKGGANIFSHDSGIGKFLKSSFGLALLLTIVMVIIVMFVYPAKEDAPMKSVFQIFIYTFVVNLIAIFFHDNIIKTELKKEQRNEVHEEILGTAFNGSASAGHPMQTNSTQPIAMLTPSGPYGPTIPTSPIIITQSETTDSTIPEAPPVTGGSKWGMKPIAPHRRID